MWLIFEIEHIPEPGIVVCCTSSDGESRATTCRPHVGKIKVRRQILNFGLKDHFPWSTRHSCTGNRLSISVIFDDINVFRNWNVSISGRKRCFRLEIQKLDNFRLSISRHIKRYRSNWTQSLLYIVVQDSSRLVNAEIMSWINFA